MPQLTAKLVGEHDTIGGRTGSNATAGPDPDASLARLATDMLKKLVVDKKPLIL